MYCCKIFGGVSAVVFWGWGFDGCSSKVLNTWMAVGIFNALLMIWGSVSTGFYLWPIVTTLGWMLRDGGCIYFACHMLYHCNGSEVGASSAIIFYNSFANLVVSTLIMLFAASATVQFVFVGVLLVLSIGLIT